MDAIARGVEATLDLLSSHSKMVMQRTIDIAQQLDIPDEEIQRWSVAKAMLDFERNRVIKSLLNKLERGPLTQRIVGMPELHRHTTKKPAVHQN